MINADRQMSGARQTCPKYGTRQGVWRLLAPKRSVLPCLASALLAACGGGDVAEGQRREPLAVSASATAAPSYDPDDLYRFFAIAFGAAPGVTYMGQLLDAANAGMSIKAIVNVFTTKPQFKETYPDSLSNQEFAQKLVDNVVGTSATSAAKAEAVADIVAALSLPDWTRGDITYAMFNNLAKKPAHDAKWAATARRMANQVAYARHYTETIKADTTVLTQLRAVVSTVTENSPVTGVELSPLIQAAVAQSRWRERTDLFPDLSGLFSRMCGGLTLVQTAIASDLNGDGRVDLVLDAWCDMNGQGVPQLQGTPYNGTIPNSLVVFQQQTNGSFALVNRALTGADLITLDGPGNLTVGDFNGDGLMDIVVAPSKEDGRNPVTFADGSDNYTAPTQVLLSDQGGRYAVSNVGPRIPGGTRSVVRDSQNRELLVIVDRAWRYAQGSWISQPHPATAGALATLQQGGTTVAVHSSVQPLSDGESYGLGVELLKQAQDATWSRVHSLVLGSMRKVPTVNLSGQTLVYTSQFLSTLGEQDWLIPSLAQGCSLDDGRFVTLLEGIPMPERYAPTKMPSFNELLPLYTSQVLVGQVDGDRIVSLATLENGEVPNLFYLNCLDVNGDGRRDIVVTRWGYGNTPRPQVFLASGSTFRRVPLEHMPPPPAAYQGAASFVADFNGDGLADLLYYPLLGMAPGHKGPITLQLYEALAPLE